MQYIANDPPRLWPVMYIDHGFVSSATRNTTFRDYVIMAAVIQLSTTEADLVQLYECCKLLGYIFLAARLRCTPYTAYVLQNVLARALKSGQK